MEELELPSEVKEILLDNTILRTERTKIVVERLRKNLFGDIYCQYDRNQLLKTLCYFDSLFKRNTCSEYSPYQKWVFFFDTLIELSAKFSKESVNEFKEKKDELDRKVIQINSTAKKLSRLMQDVDEIAAEWEYMEPYYTSAFELLIRSAKSMANSSDRVVSQSGCVLNMNVKPILRKFGKYSPSTVHLIEQIVEITDNEETEYSYSTRAMLVDNQQFNIFLNEFFKEIRRQVHMNYLPDDLIVTEKYILWVSLFKAALDIDIPEDSIGKVARKSASL